MALSFALFRHNQSFTLLILFALILFLWIPTLVHPIAIEYSGMPLFEVIQWLTFSSPYIATIVAFLLLILQGIYINLLVSRYDLIIRSSYLPSLLYILFASIFPHFRTLNPSVVANIFILLACDRLLNIYKQKIIDNLIFNASFLIALASLFSFHAIIFYCLVIVSLIIFRPFSWREWMISICGLIVPYIFITTWLILTDQQNIIDSSHLFSTEISKITLNILYRNIVGCYIVLMILIAYWKINIYLGSSTVKIKKGYSILNWFIAISFVSFLPFH
jgi:hypothetical protein